MESVNYRLLPWVWSAVTRCVYLNHVLLLLHHAWSLTSNRQDWDSSVQHRHAGLQDRGSCWCSQRRQLTPRVRKILQPWWDVASRQEAGVPSQIGWCHSPQLAQPTSSGIHEEAAQRQQRPLRALEQSYVPPLRHCLQTQSPCFFRVLDSSRLQRCNWNDQEPRNCSL